MQSYSVPDSAPLENKEICKLINKGLSPQQLFRASFTFYKASIEENLIQESEKIYVQSGIFKGMVLYPKSMGSSLLPKWLGTYESELLAMIHAHSHGLDFFVNIGSAEGYYLSGIALLLGIKCFGIDINPSAKEATSFVANSNKVTHLVSQVNTVDDGIAKSSGKLLVLIDVDGAEIEVLDDLSISLEKSSSINEVLLFIETDVLSRNRQNTSLLIKKLINKGFSIETIIRQDPTKRFVSSFLQFPFLDQAVRGCEGRQPNQSWIMATKNINS